MAARGKIARLPHQIREQLNVRMRNAEKAKPLLQWLNSLPEVQAVLAAQFGGVPILEQNLSQYRKRRYRDWLNQQEALVQVQPLVNQSPESEPATLGKLSDRLASFLLTRYAVATARLRQNGADPEKEWRLLRQFCHDLVALRRGDHQAEGLRLEQARLDFQRAKQQKTPIKETQITSATENPGLPAPARIIPSPLGRAFTTSARGSQQTSNPKCQNRRMQTDSALAFGVRELAPAFASTGSFESAGKPREITGAGPGNAIGRNISWGKPAHSKRFAQFARPQPAPGFLVRRPNETRVKLGVSCRARAASTERPGGSLATSNTLLLGALSGGQKKATSQSRTLEEPCSDYDCRQPRWSARNLRAHSPNGFGGKDRKPDWAPNCT